MKTNYEIKFPINPISIDEIEKKKNLSKPANNVNQPNM